MVTNVMSNTTAAANATIVYSSDHPAVAARDSPYTSDAMPEVTDRAPGRSRRPRRVGVVPSMRGAAMATVRPMGTFTNSTHRHEATSVRIPPSSRPSEPPAPDMAAYTPMARDRFGPSG